MSWLSSFFELFKRKPGVVIQLPAANQPIAQPIQTPEPLDPSMGAAPWMAFAKAELGVHETPGSDSTVRIIEYDAATTLKATDDAVPWCSSFACWVMLKAGIDNPRSASARSWLSWGNPILKPRYGCVVIFERGPGLGHVGFVVEDQGPTIKVLGGNQGNAVSLEDFPTYRVLGYRWPKGV